MSACPQAETHTGKSVPTGAAAAAAAVEDDMMDIVDVD